MNVKLTYTVIKARKDRHITRKIVYNGITGSLSVFHLHQSLCHRVYSMQYMQHMGAQRVLPNGYRDDYDVWRDVE